MTLRDFFQLLAENPSYILFYFLIIPFTAGLAALLGKGEGNLSPWKYLYSVLIYMACIPGIFAITLNIYFFLFERRSILDTDVLSQILPILSMMATLLLIRKNADLDTIPGFDRISGLIMTIAATLAFMWILDKTRIYAISYIPFSQVLFIFVILFLAARFGWAKLFSKSSS